MKTVLFMDIAIALVGLYLGIAAVYMRKTGKISPLVIPENEIPKCRKPAEYIEDITPSMLLFGMIAFLIGVFGVFCDLKIVSVGKFPAILELFGFLLILAGFSHQMKEAKKKYFP